MAVSIGSNVTAADYEVLRAKVDRVLGEPSGTWTTGSIGTTAGYNEDVNSPIKLPSDTITAADWNLVRADIIASYFHIFGSAPALDEVAVGENITAELYNDFETLADININNRNTVAATQRSLSSATVGTLTSSWNGVQKHAFTMTFDSENNKKGWINAGGTLRFSASASYAGADDKSLDWKTIINNVGVIDINNMSMTETGSGTLTIVQAGPTYNGWWYLDDLAIGVAQTIYTTSGADHPNYTEYDENFYEIQFIKRSSTQYEFQVICNDLDDGLPGIDANVETDITSTVQVFTASGIYVSLPVPTFAEKTPTNTFNYT